MMSRPTTTPHSVLEGTSLSLPESLPTAPTLEQSYHMQDPD